MRDDLVDRPYIDRFRITDPYYPFRITKINDPYYEPRVRFGPGREYRQSTG